MHIFNGKKKFIRNIKKEHRKFQKFNQKKLEENLLTLAAKNQEIKGLKEEIEKSKDSNRFEKLEEENKSLKALNEKDQKEINDLLEKIFDLQTNLSKQNEEIRVLTEENKKLKL